MSTVNASPYTDPQILFQQHYDSVRRDEVVGVLLALFLGCFGIHHFYLHRTGLGILYCCFCWTGIPAIIGFFECFCMPGRVRRYNAMQAAGIAAALGIAIPGYAAYPGWVAHGYAANFSQAPYGYAAAGTQVPQVQVDCVNCGKPNVAGARFCYACGAPIA